MNALLLTLAVVAQWDLLPERSVAVRSAWELTGPRAPEPTRPDVLLDTLRPLATDDAAPTPYAEIVRVLGLLPTPQVGFVDFGSGYDARVCVVAAELWKDVPIYGVEIDPARADAAREHVRELGLSDRITIITGDAIEVDVDADVGTAYLFPETLELLRPRIEKLKAFASYLHRPPGIPVVRSGDSWLFVRQQQTAYQPAAVWGGHTYSNPVCNNPRCAMCASIRGQLAARPSQVVVTVQPGAKPVTNGEGIAVEVDGSYLRWTVDGTTWNNLGGTTSDNTLFGGRWLYQGGKMFDQQGAQPVQQPATSSAPKPASNGRWVKTGCVNGVCQFAWVEDK